MARFGTRQMRVREMNPREIHSRDFYFHERGDGESSGVLQDGPDNWYRPQSIADLTTLGLPDTSVALWTFGEAAGNIIDQSGGGNDLVPNGAGHGYRQAVAGWSEPGFRIPAGANSARLGPGGLFDISDSSFWIFYVLIQSTATVRSVFFLSDSAAASELAFRKTALDFPSIKAAAVSANGAVSIADGVAHACGITWNHADLYTSIYTEDEKRSGTYGVVVDGNKGIGMGVTGCSQLDVLWGYAINSVTYLDADVKSEIYTKLGITVPWS